jgi:hypothetical protein
VFRPYTSIPVYFIVSSAANNGSEELLFAPSALLTQPGYAFDHVFSRKRNSQIIELPDWVDVDTAHILVHFLHTGTYDNLDTSPGGLNGDDKLGRDSENHVDMVEMRTELERAMKVSAVAATYGVDALVELAKGCITEYTNSLSFGQVIYAAGQAWNGIKRGPEDAHSRSAGAGARNTKEAKLWLLTRLKEKARATFNKDHNALEHDQVLLSVKDTELNKILTEWWIEFYRDLVNGIINALKATSNPTAEELELMHSNLLISAGTGLSNSEDFEHAEKDATCRLDPFDMPNQRKRQSRPS